MYKPHTSRNVVKDRPPSPDTNGTFEQYDYKQLPSKLWKKYHYAARFENASTLM